MFEKVNERKETQVWVLNMEDKLGLGNLYLRNIAQKGKKILLLHEYTKKCKESFCDPKRRLMAAPILIIPTSSEALVIVSDVLKIALGADLM